MSTKLIPASPMQRTAGGSLFAVNARHDGMAFRNIKCPKMFDMDESIKYAHVAQNSENTYTHYITWDVVDGYTNVGWFDECLTSRRGTFTVDAVVREVKHVGNTLVFICEDGIQYALFEDGNYRVLGSKPPTPKIRFKVTKPSDNDIEATGTTDVIDDGFYMPYCTEYTGISEYEDENNLDGVSIHEFAKAFTTSLSSDFESCYNLAMHNMISEHGYLPEFPIFVRVAVRLYDGTYMLHSAPLLIARGDGIDSVLYDVFPIFGKKPASGTEATQNRFQAGYRIGVQAEELHFSLDADYSDWKDVVAGVDVFISDYIQPVKTGEVFDAKYFYLANRGRGFNDIDTAAYRKDYIKNFISNLKYCGFASASKLHQKFKPTFKHTLPDSYKYLFTSRNDVEGNEVPHYTTDEIRSRVIDESKFYLLKEIDLEGGKNAEDGVERDSGRIYTNGFISLKKDVKEKFETLTARQHSIVSDDTGTHNSVIANYAYVYNQKFHLCDVTTRYFAGYDPGFFFIRTEDNSYSKYNGISSTEVRIKKADTTHVSRATYQTDADCWGFYSPMLFYPDTDALNLLLFNAQSHKYISVQLAHHDFLNGAYHVTDNLMPHAVGRGEYKGDTFSVTASVREQNRIVATPVSNPFVFDTSNSNLVGSGSIIACAAITTALSTGQFGQHQLYVFCSDGIYSMAVDDKGSYTSVHPVSSDILLSPDLLTQAVASIYFATSQGVKILKGSDTVIVSQALDLPMSHYEWKGARMPSEIASLLCHRNEELLTMDLRTFLNNHAHRCRLDFDYAHSEVWLTCKGASAAMVYNTLYKNWHVRTMSIDKVINVYPSLLMMLTEDSGQYHGIRKVCDVSVDDISTSLPAVIISQPTGGSDFVKIEDVSLHGRICAESVSMCVFAGTTQHTMVLASSRTLKAYADTKIHSIRTGRIPQSLRYIAFAVAISSDDFAIDSYKINALTTKYKNNA